MAETELKRELPKNHVLADCKFVAVGESMNYDDYLFVTDCDNKPLAAVHLTWSVETDPIWPSTATYPTIDAWIKAMSDDHAEFQLRFELDGGQTNDVN